LLFADLVGFSKLTEEQVPNFIEGFLGTLAKRMKSFPFKPLYKNLWGDALYFVFAEYEAAALCGLLLRDMMRETDWGKLGLPANLSMRIGLHAGPVFRSREPFLNHENFFGYHVNQAARIEPITSPGNVYASEQFAALLMGAKADTIDCRYVGVVVLPKDFGSYPIYHIKRRFEIE
jgi:class 3 adenylate cyclase